MNDRRRVKIRRSGHTAGKDDAFGSLVGKIRVKHISLDGNTVRAGDLKSADTDGLDGETRAAHKVKRHQSLDFFKSCR